MPHVHKELDARFTSAYISQKHQDLIDILKTGMSEDVHFPFDCIKSLARNRSNRKLRYAALAYLMTRAPLDLLVREYPIGEFVTEFTELNAIHQAITYNRLDFIEWLIQHNVNFNVEHYLDVNPVFFAIYMDRVEILQKLLMSRENGGAGLNLLQFSFVFIKTNAIPVIWMYCQMGNRDLGVKITENDPQTLAFIFIEILKFRIKTKDNEVVNWLQAKLNSLSDSVKTHVLQSLPVLYAELGQQAINHPAFQDVKRLNQVFSALLPYEDNALNQLCRETKYLIKKYEHQSLIEIYANAVKALEQDGISQARIAFLEVYANTKPSSTLHNLASLSLAKLVFNTNGNAIGAYEYLHGNATPEATQLRNKLNDILADTSGGVWSASTVKKFFEYYSQRNPSLLSSEKYIEGTRELFKQQSTGLTQLSVMKEMSFKDKSEKEIVIPRQSRGIS